MNSDTYWLVVTNIGLGLVVAICLVVVGFAVVKELADRKIRRRRLSAELDRDLKDLVAHYEADPHVFEAPGLGYTMADGGEKLGPEDPDEKR